MTTKIWHEQNAERRKANKRTYREAKDQRVPPWSGFRRVATAAYTARKIEAKRLTLKTSIKHVVDHEVPSRGRYVSGLHVPWNFQVLDDPTNSGKCNRWDDTIDPKAWPYGPEAESELDEVALSMGLVKTGGSNWYWELPEAEYVADALA